MCYASPGPRCESHAKERHAKLQAKSAASWQKVRDVEKEMFKVEPKGVSDGKEPSKEYQKLAKKRDTLFTKWEKNYKDASEAKTEINATRGGIKTLRMEIAKTMHDGSTEAAIHRNYLTKLLDNGTETFNKRMVAYDTKHGTVDGRDPSPYGDDAGVQKLREKTRSLREQYENETQHAKREAIYKKYKSANNALDHAAKTRDYAQKGLVNPYKASLNTNQDMLKQRMAESDKAQKEYKKVNIARVERVADMAEIRRQEFRAGRENFDDYSPEAKKKIKELQAESDAFYSKVYLPAEESAREAQRNVFTAKNAVNLGLSEAKPKTVSPSKTVTKSSFETRFNRADGNYKSAYDEPKFNRADGNYKK